MLDHNANGPDDALAALKDVQELLSAHPRFESGPVRASSDTARKPSVFGRIIKSFRFRKFGAEFSRDLTLLRFLLRRETPRTLILELQWHTTHVGDERSVFIHFVDAADEIRFQGDYSLDGETPDALGYFYSRRRVEVPEEAPVGTYRVRLGVWSPAENRHATLGRFRGCIQEPAGWCHNAVVLDSVEISKDRMA